ncbi:MAG: hypothetical protein WCT37_04530 [Patescibacteria group bacterium]
MPACKNCQSAFTIYPEDIKFYGRIGVPEPTLCPDCRAQERLAWRSERSLHYRQCDLCGRDHMSSYAESAPFPVYCLDCWYSDKWDQLQNGREFDFNRPFFPQFHELQLLSPRGSLFVSQGTIFNSDYTNTVTNVKNCYLIFGSNDCEDCYYSSFLKKCFSVSDCTEVYQSEKCYDSVNCEQCYNVVGSNNSRGCRDSAFLEDCSGCSDCFGCVNLRNQKFCLWNEQLSESEYRRQVGEIDLHSRKAYERNWDIFNQLRIAKGVYKYYHGVQNINSTGDYLSRCKNAFHAFDCYDVEDCRYVTRLTGSKDCFDVDHFGWAGLESVYYSASCGNSASNLKFVSQVWGSCRNIEYSNLCLNNCHDCFGCVALTHKQFCIFNRQYEEEEYLKLKEKIIEHMKKSGEYGQFFPKSFSHVPYHDSLAQDYYPLTAEQAQEQGWRWEEEDKKYQPATVQLLDNLAEVKDEIIKEVLVCAECGRNYKIVSQELKVYRAMDLPLPAKCFDCRLRTRLNRKNPRRFYNRQCAKCGTEIKTTYAPDRPEKVYCEECYRKEIY